MGQKTNPEIFRLGVNKIWKTEFAEKKLNEFKLYSFIDLEIKDYIKRYLEINGLILHDYRLHYSESTLNFYISYFIKSNFSIKKENKTRLLLVKSKSIVKKVSSNSIKVTSVKGISPTFSRKNFPEAKFTISNNEILNFSGKNIANEMFKVISRFTDTKYKIAVHFHCLNKDSYINSDIKSKSPLLIQKFRNTSFLKEGSELLRSVIESKDSASLLTKFIAIQIQKEKRHNFFMSFLKKTLTGLLNSEFSKKRGIKITIKGRLNGRPRAKHKTIIIGTIPAQTISSEISFYQDVSHNSNGSYGIKVWVIKTKNVFTT